MQELPTKINPVQATPTPALTAANALTLVPLQNVPAFAAATVNVSAKSVVEVVNEMFGDFAKTNNAAQTYKPDVHDDTYVWNDPNFDPHDVWITKQPGYMNAYTTDTSGNVIYISAWNTNPPPYIRHFKKTFFQPDPLDILVQRGYLKWDLRNLPWLSGMTVQWRIVVCGDRHPTPNAPLPGGLVVYETNMGYPHSGPWRLFRKMDWPLYTWNPDERGGLLHGTTSDQAARFIAKGLDDALQEFVVLCKGLLDAIGRCADKARFSRANRPGI